MVKGSRGSLCLLGAFIATVAVTGSSTAATLTITPSSNPVAAGVPVAFQIVPNVLNTGDTVSFNFGDGYTGKVEYTTACGLLGGCEAITHAYAGPGVFTVTATGTIASQAVSGVVQVTVTTSTADQEIYVPTGAHLTGYKDVNWRTDLEINNPGRTRATYAITLLVRDQNNTAPAFTSTFTLNPGRSARYEDLLYGTFGFSGAAAIRLTPIDGPILVTSRTYNQVPDGTYGQSVPALPRAMAIGFNQDAYLIGLSHDPTLAGGYRTNLGFVNASPATIHVEAEFYLASGAFLGRVAYDLLPLVFRQIDRAFEVVTPDNVNDGYIVVRTTTAGAKFFAYAVVTDNRTGDPTYVTAAVAPQ
jgi:hypothetical protein